MDDLPEGERKKFMPISNDGFVKESAAIEERRAEEIATSENKRRSLLDKLLRRDRITPNDVLQGSAEYEESFDRTAEPSVRHTREAYEDTEARKGRIEDQIREPMFKRESYKQLMETELTAAENRLAELKKNGEREAVALNERYDRLKETALNANEALTTFMRNELGILDDTRN